VDTTYSLGSTGTWLGQPVPFRIVGSLAFRDQAEVTIGAGAVLEFTGSSLDVFNSTLIVAGTAEAPVTFTSSQASPVAGDWGCIVFSSVTGVPRFDYAVIEYAGSGSGCSGANYETALRVPATAVITNSTFRHIAGSAISSSNDCDEAWCDNKFDDVETGPLLCTSSDTPNDCL
jgi:hypothetical protein